MQDIISSGKPKFSPQSSETIMHSLEASHMVSKGDVKETTFGGTIWDNPEEREQNIETGGGTTL